MHQRQQSRATSNLLELWLQQHSTKLEWKKITTSRYLQWKRADRANNNNKYNERESVENAGVPRIVFGKAKRYTRKCVIFIYFDFMRIFSFMWLPIFESIQAIEYIVSLSPPFLWMLFSFRWCCSLFVLLSHSLFATHMPKKVQAASIEPIFFCKRRLYGFVVVTSYRITRMQSVNSFALRQDL